MPYPGGVEEAALLLAPKPNDVHTQTAAALGITRDQAKSIRYAISYGAQPPKIAAMFGWTLVRAKQIFTEFWKVNAATAALKTDLVRQWLATGKRYIIGIDGRKLATRSEHSLLNTLFQSCGVIVMKKAHLLVDKQNLKEGYCVDPFVGRPTSMFMVCYHDESAHAVQKAEFSFKMEPYIKGNKESEKAAKEKMTALKLKLQEEEGRTWSDVNHSDKFYYIAYSRSGEITAKALELAGEHFQLRASVTGGYSVGNSWANTH